MDRREFLIFGTLFLGGCTFHYGEYPSRAKQGAEEAREKFDAWVKKEKKQEDEMKKLARVEHNSTLESYTRKYDTIAHKVLDIEKEHGVVPGDYKFIDDFIDSSLAVFKHSFKSEPASNTISDARRIFSAINGVVRENFSYKKSDLLNSVFKTRKIDCDTTSYLYIAVAEVINMPLFAVHVPGHVFVRFEKDGKRYNWETTSGHSRSDESYIKEHKLSEQAVKNGAYMRSLNKQETLAIAYRARGHIWNSKGELEKTIQDYTKAIELDSRDPINYWVRAQLLTNKGELEKAIKDYDKALELDPENSEYQLKRTTLELRISRESLRKESEELDRYAREMQEQRIKRLEELEKQLEEIHKQKIPTDKQQEPPSYPRRKQEERQADYLYKITGNKTLDLFLFIGCVYTATAIITNAVKYFFDRNKTGESEDKP